VSAAGPSLFQALVFVMTVEGPEASSGPLTGLAVGLEMASRHPEEATAALEALRAMYVANARAAGTRPGPPAVADRLAEMIREWRLV